MKIHHIGYLVSQMPKSTAAFESMGFQMKGGVYFDTDRQADICFMDGQGILLELIAPAQESDLYPLLKKYPNQPYHLCYEVRDMDTAVQNLTRHGFLLFKPPARARAIHENAYVAFLLHRNIGMIELLQREWGTKT